MAASDPRRVENFRWHNMGLTNTPQTNGEYPVAGSIAKVAIFSGVECAGELADCLGSARFAAEIAGNATL